MCRAKKLNLVDMYGIGLMLEHLVAEGNITCEERDRVILRIARENDIAEYMLSNLAGYGRSKQEVLERAKRRKGLESQGKNGGTFAHPMIACEFASWIAPEFKMQLLKLSLDRTKLR